MKESIIKNFFFAFGAQVVSLSASLVVTFVVPTLIGVEDFSYWQLFLTYVTYVNLSRLGLSDGLYLRLGGKKYKDLEYDLLSHERIVFVISQLFVSISLIIVFLSMEIDEDRLFVLLACCVCIVIVNSNGFLIYILQAVNLTKIYSVSVILQNIPWFFAAFIIFFFKVYDYKIVIIMYILGHILTGIYVTLHTKEIVKLRQVKFNYVLNDIKENVKCGIVLMTATYTGSLIIASVRMVVDTAWGVVEFGYFSFALTLSNVLLTFINQISIIVFPALRRISAEKQQTAYFFLRNILSFILPIIMLGYLPITLFVKFCLPQYEDSLQYLSVFLPICMLDGKMQMLCASFFKSMRKEKVLLTINISTLFLSVSLALIGAYIIKDIYFVAIAVLLVVSVRSIVSEIVLAKLMNVKINKDLLQEVLLVVLFVAGTNILDMYLLFFASIIVYGVYLLINIKKIKKIIELKKKF